MAVGTVTPVVDTNGGLTGPVNLGSLAVTVTTVVGSASYTTGGDSLTAKQLGLSKVLFAVVQVLTGGASNAGAVNANYIASTGKLQAWTSASAQVGSAANISGITFQVIAFGQK